MQLIYDNLSAILIGTTVLLILGFLQVRTSQNSVEQVSAHAAKTKALSFGEWIEDDIVSLGKNLGNDLGRFSLPDTLDDGNTGRWVFYSDSLLSGGAVQRHFTRYRLESKGTRVLDNDTLTLYQAYRETADSPIAGATEDDITEAEWLEDGRSVATLSFFEIVLLLSDGRETTDVEAADFIRVRFAMVPEYDLENSYLHEYYWTTTLKVRPFWEPIDASGSTP